MDGQAGGQAGWQTDGRITRQTE